MKGTATMTTINALELIKLLTIQVQKHGDCPVAIFSNKDENVCAPINDVAWHNGIISIKL